MIFLTWKFHSSSDFVILQGIKSCRVIKMIKCHLSRLMGEHKMKIADVARAIDVHRNTITNLYDEKAVRIEIDVIDKLCQLFKCQVSDLFEFVAEAEEK